MNVLLLTSTFPTMRESWRGTYVLECARSLALRHNVTVVYPERLTAPNVGNEPFFIDEYLQPRVRFLNFTYTHFPKSWLISYVAAFRKVLNRINTEQRIDVIFAHVVLPAGAAAVVWGRRLNVPVILTEHWGPAGDWLKQTAMPPRLMRAIIRKVYGRADYLTAVSDSLAEDIVRTFGTRVDAKFDQPIDCDFFRPQGDNVDAEARRVLCVTRADDPRKDVPNLLAAWKIVAREMADSVCLQIAAPDVRELAAEVERKGISRSCELIGSIPQSGLAALFQKASLIVIPSRYETFGRTGAEGLACGVPVVSTRCGGPDEYITEGTGLMVPAENPGALAEAIMVALQRRDKFLSPGELARKICDRFGYETVCQRFTDIAESLIK
jgi:glycosyltransferase involved in cell wall biosynthesis